MTSPGDIAPSVPAGPQHTRHLRVLVVTNMFPHSEDPARGSFVKAQVDALIDARVSVEVVHIRGDRNAINYVTAVPEIRRCVDRLDPDVVYAFYGLSGWCALWQSRPLVLSLAGDDVLGTPTGRGGRKLKSLIGIGFSQWAASRADAVCVQSEEMRDRLWGKTLRTRSLVVPYGVDQKRFSPGDRLHARERLGLPPDAPIVLFPNTPTEPRKRIDIAREAVALVRKTLPNTVFQITSGVRHENMPFYYRAADCCLLTSDWEGSPNVVKEALLCGLPVVSTRVGDVAKWLALSPESSLCDRTPSAVAAAILKVIVAQRRVDPTPLLVHFSNAAIASRMIQLFKAIVPKSRLLDMRRSN